MQRVRAGIVGGTGYTGVELLRLLNQHPQVEVAVITSRKEAGMPVAQLFPSLRGRYDIAFSQPDVNALKQCGVVFFATPNGVAMNDAQELLDLGVRIVDLSADFRLRDAAVWQQWYGMQHAAPQLLSEAIYGLCEVNREQIRAARLVANPGCYPTATQLGFLPLLEAKWIDADHLIADAISGTSGAGRKAEMHLMLAEASESFCAYGVPGHRHWPEIRQGLAAAAGTEVGLVFTPHLAPMIRGIHATLYGRLTEEALARLDASPSDLQSLYDKRFAGEPFVDVMPAGSHPETRGVRAANLCRIAVHRPPEGAARRDTVVVLSVIDNLVKGAAGQAVQNMNIMLGFPESMGLEQLAVVP